VVERPSWARVTVTGVFVILTNLSRGSTGYSFILATFLIAGWFAVGRANAERKRWALPIVLVGILAMAIGCAIDLAKFDVFFGFPASEQVLFKVYGLRRINGGRYFGLRFIPSTFQAYLSPGNLRVTPVFPYLALPNNPTHLVAHTTLFTRAPTAGVVPSMPLLAVTGFWGGITSFLPGRPMVVRILLIATLATAATVMTFGWVLERFVGDFLPLLMLASMVGMVDIWRRLTTAPRSARLLTMVAACLLGLFGFAANMGIAITPDGNWTRSQVDRYVLVEQTLSDITGHPLSREVVAGTNFPAGATTGQLFIKGRCDELYIADQIVPNGVYNPLAVWLPVERSPHTPICDSLLTTATRIPLRTEIVVPRNHETVTGSAVALVAAVSSGDPIQSVLFELVGGSPPQSTILGTGSKGTYGWTYSWDSRSVPNGTYVLRGVAIDAQGKSISLGVSMTVHNSGPVPQASQSSRRVFEGR